ncbi:MAG: ABC transporter ATP-binding protein [Burkholderiales bacterium]|nr:ABC transporter ATP-binding protein [Burkholderiales bacterium]
MKRDAGLLRVQGLRIEVATAAGWHAAIDDLALVIGPGECLVLCGESGSGKSLTALALMRLLPEGVRQTAGTVWLGDTELTALPEAAMRRLRGGRLAMIFQEPMVSLNPVMRIDRQIAEALRAHRGLAGRAAAAEVARLLDAVGLKPEHGLSYPFQLSGGQRQRTLIAMMLAGEPEVLIADEPTTALDVTVQAQILRLLKRLQRERGMGLLLITHDLDLAHDVADRVVVMYAGQIVEEAPRDALYTDARHPYTQALMRAMPAHGQGPLQAIPGAPPAVGAAFTGCRFADRCERVQPRCVQEAPALSTVSEGHRVRCHLAGQPAAARTPGPAQGGREQGEGPVLLQVEGLAVRFPIRRGLLRRTVGWVRAVDGVSLTVDRAETLALVGESGCGKTTLARAILRLIEPSAGRVLLNGVDLTRLSSSALRRARADMQIVFQDPYGSLNPRLRVSEIIAEGIAALRPELGRQARQRRVGELLEQVGLPQDAAARYPHAFSGGQRQRIAIARALAVEPKLLILDEPTSALDVSVQAQILGLLEALQARHGLAYLFITHNLPLVARIARRVLVMYRGRVVEAGPTRQLFAQPLHPYTRLLLASAPGQGLAAAVEPAEHGPDVTAGCAYAARCALAEVRCRRSEPPLAAHGEGRVVACWLAGPR